MVGDGFIARGMTFRNTAGASNHQAVALRSGSDLSVYYQCSFEGYQDTLYTYSERQFYRECDIYGTVDFIFGNAAVVFQNYNIFFKLINDSFFIHTFIRSCTEYIYRVITILRMGKNDIRK